jgi:Fur family ferric uptake transcriptional regulator
MRTSSVEQIILETLTKEHTHLTSLQVYEQIHDRLPAVNPSTVYRALERLVHRGQVSISDMGIGAAVYELVGNGLHHHLVCQNCKQVLTISHEEVKTFFSEIETKNGYQILTNHLILFGLCENCRKNGAGSD